MVSDVPTLTIAPSSNDEIPAFASYSQRGVFFR